MTVTYRDVAKHVLFAMRVDHTPRQLAYWMTWADASRSVTQNALQLLRRRGLAECKGNPQIGFEWRATEKGLAPGDVDLAPKRKTRPPRVKTHAPLFPQARPTLLLEQLMCRRLDEERPQ